MSALRSQPFRIIADVASPPVTLLPPVGGVVQPLDLTMAISRAVSPVHIEYLRNMGVGASLSSSIIADGKLWGLIVCHNETARLPSFVMRTAAELFGQMYSLTLESRLHQAASVDAERVALLSDRLLSSIASDPSLLQDAQWLQEVSRDMIVSDGVAIYHNGEIFTSGAARPTAKCERSRKNLPWLPQAACSIRIASGPSIPILLPAPIAPPGCWRFRSRAFRAITSCCSAASGFKKSSGAATRPKPLKR